MVKFIERAALHSVWLFGLYPVSGYGGELVSIVAADDAEAGDYNFEFLLERGGAESEAECALGGAVDAGAVLALPVGG